MVTQQSILVFQELVAHMFKIFRAERSIFFKDLPLTPAQYDVLQCLNEKSMNLSALSETLVLDSSTLVGIIDRLEKKEWVKKKVSPQDRRKNILTITDKGKQAFKAIPQFTSESLRSALQDLTQKEQIQLNYLMSRLIGIMETSGNSPMIPETGINFLDLAKLSHRREGDITPPSVF